jgi:hypothetical protein
VQELQSSAPLQAYQELLKRHTQLVGQHRQLVEDRAEAICGASELLQLRQDVTDLTACYLNSAVQGAKLQAQARLPTLRAS